jgi:Uma2 family endonuclease
MTPVTTADGAEALLGRLRREGRVLLTGVSWREYRGFLDRVEPRAPRFTYDRGRFEIMTTSREHEIYRWLIGRLLEVWAEETATPLSVGGEMTFEREDLDRGLQPDECYWIQNEPRVRGRLNLDFRQDPPPDLILEAEVSHTVLDRLAVLAALGVPEVWRFDGTALQIGLLQPGGEYHWGDRSAAFPALPTPEIVRFVQMWHSSDHLGVVRAFRAWVRQRLGG